MPLTISGELPSSVDAPVLQITRYEKFVAALMTTATAASAMFVLAVVVWGMNAIPAASGPLPPPGIERPLSQDADPALSESIVESPEAVENDQSVSNEQPAATSLEEIENVEAVAAEAGSVSPPNEITPAQTSLPNEATGTGGQPIGGGNEKGSSTFSNQRLSRWVFEYRNVESVDQYARWLEALEIQPAAVFTGTGRIVYLSELTASVPQTKSMNQSEVGVENRFHISWESDSADFQKADQELFHRAEIDVLDSKIYHFVSAATEAHLAKLGRILRETQMSLRSVEPTSKFASLTALSVSSSFGNCCIEIRLARFITQKKRAGRRRSGSAGVSPAERSSIHKWQCTACGTAER